MKVSAAFELLEIEAANPVLDTDNDTDDSESGRVGAGAGHFYHVHESLKNAVVTRWNSTFHMINSVLENYESIGKLLLRLGLRDLRLDEDELVMLRKLKDLLAPFETFIQIVLSNRALLSLVSLIRAEIYDSTLVSSDLNKRFHSAIVYLKRNIHANIDKRLPITHAIKMASLFDPSTKANALQIFEIDYDANAVTSGRGIVNAFAPIVGTGTSAVVAKIYEIINKEYIAMYPPDDNASSDDSFIASQAASSSPSVVVASTALGANANQSPSSSFSLKLALISKLERRSGVVNDTSASALQCIQQELVSYLSPLSLTEEEKHCPLSFWAKHSEYLYLSKFAKYYLAASASSVPVECMFSVTVIIDNAKHSRLDPYKINQWSFIHDNYSKFFQVKK